MLWYGEYDIYLIMVNNKKYNFMIIYKEYFNYCEIILFDSIQNNYIAVIIKRRKFILNKSQCFPQNMRYEKLSWL